MLKRTIVECSYIARHLPILNQKKNSIDEINIIQKINRAFKHFGLSTFQEGVHPLDILQLLESLSVYAQDIEMNTQAEYRPVNKIDSDVINFITIYVCLHASSFHEQEILNIVTHFAILAPFIRQPFMLAESVILDLFYYCHTPYSCARFILALGELASKGLMPVMPSSQIIEQALKVFHRNRFFNAKDISYFILGVTKLLKKQILPGFHLGNEWNELIQDFAYTPAGSTHVNLLLSSLSELAEIRSLPFMLHPQTIHLMQEAIIFSGDGYEDNLAFLIELTQLAKYQKLLGGLPARVIQNVLPFSVLESLRLDDALTVCDCLEQLVRHNCLAKDFSPEWSELFLNYILNLKTNSFNDMIVILNSMSALSRLNYFGRVIAPTTLSDLMTHSTSLEIDDASDFVQFLNAITVLIANNMSDLIELKELPQLLHSFIDLQPTPSQIIATMYCLGLIARENSFPYTMDADLLNKIINSLTQQRIEHPRQISVLIYVLPMITKAAYLDFKLDKELLNNLMTEVIRMKPHMAIVLELMYGLHALYVQGNRPIEFQTIDWEQFFEMIMSQPLNRAQIEATITCFETLMDAGLIASDFAINLNDKKWSRSILFSSFSDDSLKTFSLDALSPREEDEPDFEIVVQSPPGLYLLKKESPCDDLSPSRKHAL